MFRKAVIVSAVLIGTYLAVFYWTGFSKDVAATGGAGANVIRAFQGR